MQLFSEQRAAAFVNLLCSKITKLNLFLRKGMRLFCVIFKSNP